MVNRDTQAKNKDPPDAMPALIERPKMSLEMWAAMKSHIMKQRERKKELEADAAIERQRREQEMKRKQDAMTLEEIKRKQDAMTLEEIKDQLNRFENNLLELKEEKHQLFLQLKKVLNEDETRRRAQVKEARYSEMVAVSHGYAPHGMTLGAPPPLYMHATPGPHLLNRGAPTLYKVGMPPQQNLMPPGAMKRPRSSSPPAPQQHSGFHQNFNFKTHMTTFGQKQNLFAGNQSPAFYSHPSQASQIVQSSPVVNSSVSAVVTIATAPSSGAAYSTFPAQFVPSEQQQTGGPKHLNHPSYHVPHLSQQGFVNSLQQQLEQANQKPNFPEEKYYVQQSNVVPIRGVTPLAAGQTIIPIQQPSKVTGSITSGYPVRTQPQQSAPASHFQQAGTAGVPPSHHNTFPVQSRLAFPGQSNPRYYN